MTSVSTVKEVYEVEFKYGAVFTGGKIDWFSDGSKLICQSSTVITIQDIANGHIVSTLESPQESEDQDLIVTFVLGADNKTVVTSHKSGLFKLWNIDEEKKLCKQWRSTHQGPVPRLALQGSILASGGIDSRVRLWDITHKSCLHNLPGLSGVTSVLEFRPKSHGKESIVFAAADDTVIRSWNVKSGEQLTAFTGHFSKITALVFARDKVHMVSASRDRVMILWDLATGVAKRTVPAYEAIEGLVLLPASFTLPTGNVIDTGINVAMAGANGVIRVWNMLAARELYVQQNSLVAKGTDETTLAVTQLLFNEQVEKFAVVAVDHNIFIHPLDTFKCEKVVVGFLDEILDIALLGVGESHIAVASNGADVKLYRRSDMECQLLRGHTDIVLALAVTPADPSLLVSGSKDNTVRLWRLDADTNSVECLAVGAAHTGSIGGVAFANGSADKFASASQDTCLKLWSWDATKGLNAKHTVVAHKKDINAVAFAPNDTVVATVSEDHTAKLWSGKKLKPIGVLSGHRRSVWGVAFAPLQPLVATASADCTVRIWRLGDLSCTHSLQDGETGVLRCAFLAAGHQLVASGVDGVIKMWDLSGEKVVKMDLHNSRVWALTVSHDESRIITGDSDSQLVVWKDATQERREEKIEKANLLVAQEQLLANLLRSNKLFEALKLAITLERPLQVLKICKQVLKTGGESDLRLYIGKLRGDQKKVLMDAAVTWNTNSRNVYVAQCVLNLMIYWLSVRTLEAVPRTIEDVLPYTDRHFQRLTKLMQDVRLLEYTAILGQPNMKEIEKSG